MPDVLNVLVLCTGNSARSILAESLINHLGRGRFRAWSAGSKPTGRVHPLALEVLAENGITVDGVRSKSWDEFSGDAPVMDLVITVCDNAAGETCPLWPGTPIKVHWGIPDPAAAAGDAVEKRQAFRDAFRLLDRRVRKLVALQDLHADNLKTELQRIHAES